MRRTHIRLDESDYREIKRLASASGESMAAVIRGLIENGLGKRRKEKPKKLSLSDFSFIGSFRAGAPCNMSERHDDLLGEDEW